MFIQRLIRGYFGVLARAAPGLAERHATRVFFTPRPRRRRPPGPLGGVAPRPFRVRAGAETMRCWSYGSGPAVVFVHGWGGCAHDWTFHASRVLAAGYRAILCDFPAHGVSTGRQTTLPDMARALHALADELAQTSSGRFLPLEAVVAHSFGGAAAALAARDGLLVRCLVLLAPVAYPMSFLDPVARALGLDRERRDGMEERIRVRVGGDLSVIDPLRAIARVEARGLIVHDRADAAVPWEHGRAMARAWPGAATRWTDGLGHRGVLRDPGVTEGVTAFLSAARGDPVEPRPWPGLLAQPAPVR